MFSSFFLRLPLPACNILTLMQSFNGKPRQWKSGVLDDGDNVTLSTIIDMVWALLVW